MRPLVDTHVRTCASHASSASSSALTRGQDRAEWGISLCLSLSLSYSRVRLTSYFEFVANWIFYTVVGKIGLI